MTGYIKIQNSIAQQANYDDIATAHGWTGYLNVLDANGRPILNTVDGEAVVNENGSMFQQQPITSQKFIALMYKKFSEQIAATACQHQEILKGKLNYDAAQMIQMFKQTTTVEWISENIGE